MEVGTIIGLVNIDLIKPITGCESCKGTTGRLGCHIHSSPITYPSEKLSPPINKTK